MTRWAIAAGQQLRHRCWQDEYVVYNDLSGDTHLLSSIAWEVLSVLKGQSSDSAGLAGALGLDGDPDTGAELQDLLSSLHQLGLLDTQ